MTATREALIWHDQMRLAFTLAKRGPLVNENPRVGCVLATDEGIVVAEGFHRGAGTPHAEVDALSALSAKGISAKGLTAIVTLEPCRHVGRTGPCAQALIDAGVRRVVFSLSDPGGESAGGAHLLQDHGVEVIGGVLPDLGMDLLRHWYTATSLGRPFVTAKWAQSLDGRSAAADGTSQWITSADTRSRVHEDRSQHGAILVGTETALVDNPSLTARRDDGTLYPTQPHAVVMGLRDLPGHAKIFDHPGGVSHFRTHAPTDVLSTLYSRGIRSLYLEGGATIVAAFLRENLVDELHITMGPLLLGGDRVAVTDIGVTTLDEAKHLDLVDFYVTGGDITIVARPRSTPTSLPTPAKEA
jgi:diaminohydroxyphosphoribosylaminopyrimidine deaminase/5-amino-6-(5-phosphoribosylamino)uracil reductase